MVCHLCQAADAKKFGRDRKGHQRYRCRTCRKTFSERPARLLGDMRIPEEKAVLILSLLCEGSGVRAVERITGCHKATILSLLVQVGEGCESSTSTTPVRHRTNCRWAMRADARGDG